LSVAADSAASNQTLCGCTSSPLSWLRLENEYVSIGWYLLSPVEAGVLQQNIEVSSVRSRPSRWSATVGQPAIVSDKTNEIKV
jgi:hypothetical protein